MLELPTDANTPTEQDQTKSEDSELQVNNLSNGLGGKLSVQYTAKKSSPVLCGDTQVPLQGIPQFTKTQFKNLPKRRRTVTRAYGGSLSASAVRHRILRAFFNEELKIIKQAASTSKKGKKKQLRKK